MSLMDNLVAIQLNRVKRIMPYLIRPIELRDVATCQAIVREN
jgi:hypothetical protein